MGRSRAAPRQVARSIGRLVIPTLVLTTMAISARPASAQDAAPKPPLSAALRSALTTSPPDSVRTRFEAEFAARGLQYEIDGDGLNELAMEYMQAGDMEKGAAVMAVISMAGRVMMESMMPEAARSAAEAAERERAARSEQRPPQSRVGEEEAARQRRLELLGPPRDDLERFYGLYEDPDGQPNRWMFLVATCEGHLAFGPMWADVAEWRMRSLSDTEFETIATEFQESFRVKVIVGPDGKATGLEHGWDGLGSPLVRTGDLPEEFEPRCEDGG